MPAWEAKKGKEADLTSLALRLCIKEPLLTTQLLTHVDGSDSGRAKRVFFGLVSLVRHVLP